MFNTELPVGTLRAVAMIVVAAVLLWSTGLPGVLKTLEASDVTNASDTLTNSAPSQSSVHTIGFSTENGLLTGETIVISFPAGFDLTGLDINDISMTINGNATSTAASSGAGVWGVATGTPTAQDVQFTTPTDQGAASSSTFVLTIGSEGGTSITNPSATSSYGIDIGGSMQDSGQVRVAIIDEVTVSADIETSITFTVAEGINPGASVNGTSTTGTSTPTTLPFGNLGIGVINTLAQRLNVATNATNGFNVTVEYDGELQSGSGATIDGFVDGTNTTTPTAWQSPSANTSNSDTFGHWGVTSDDTSIPSRSEQFGSNEWVSGSTSPISIMGHNGPSDGTTSGTGSTTIGYQLEITALQEAGDDYNTTLRYVITTTF